MPADTDLPLVLIGAGGHARVLHALGVAAGLRFMGVCDPVLTQKGERFWNQLPVIDSEAALERLPRDSVRLVNGIGKVVGNNIRQQVYARLSKVGFRFATLIHPAAWVAPDVQLSDGVQIMAGAVVQPGCTIGADCIINTRASVDHDCIIGNHVHVAPGATLCGSVEVADNAFIGAGAVVIQTIRIGSGAVVAAGATVARDLLPDHILMPGKAARPIKQ